jgi:hypothetical protein
MAPATSAFISHLDDEIDLFADDSSSNPSVSSSSSAFENLSAWHNDYFQQRNFYPNYFPADSTLPVLSSATTTNIDNDNSANTFTSNALTFM